MKKLTGLGILALTLLSPLQEVGAQTHVVAVAEENFRARPNGAKLGTLKRGAAFAAVAENGRWVKGSLPGWIWEPSVRSSGKRSIVTVGVANENVRSEPGASAQILGTVLRGTELAKVGQRKNWVQVVYEGWIWEPSLSTSTTKESSADTKESSAEKPTGSPAGTERTLAVTEENLRSAPNGSRLGKLRRGADLTVLSRKGEWLRIATRGYFFASSAKGSGSSWAVGKATENLRIAPGSEIVGVLDRGAPLEVIGRSGGWLEVEVRGWIWEPSTLALDPGRTRAGDKAAEEGKQPVRIEAETSAEAAPATVPGTARATAETRRTERDVARTAGRRDTENSTQASVTSARTLKRSVSLKDGPQGATVAQAPSGSSVVPIKNEGDWVKVRIEGWVPRDALRAGAEPGSPTVAMVISDPDQYRGAEATWRLELIAVLEADRGRRDFTPGEHYLLTRSATGEREYVYVVVPEKLVKRLDKLRPFSPITVKGTIRTGRSALVGNPILELRQIIQQRS